MNVQIKATHLKLTPEITAYINKKIESLKKYSEQIIEARIEVGITTQHHRSGQIYRAEANLKLPQKLLRVEKIAGNLTKAIDKVRDHLEEELRRYKGYYQTKQRRASKTRRELKSFPIE